MIYEVFGLPRSGKTTFLTSLAQRAAKKRSVAALGRSYERVYTNFPCEGCYRIDFDSLPYFDYSNSLVIIDEISLYADNRKYKDFNADLLYFFKLHGHYKLDLVWCSQSLNDADKKIRDVTDTIFYLRPFAFSFSSIIQIKHAIDFKDRQVFDCYDVVPLSFRLFYRKKWYKYFDSYEHKELPEYKSEKWIMPLRPSTTLIKAALSLPIKLYSYMLKSAAKLNMSKNHFTKTFKLCNINKSKRGV